MSRIRTSDVFWQGYDHSQWTGFMQHDFSNPSRQIAYDLIRKIIVGAGRDIPLMFSEIGFGGAYDFENCFKELEDNAQIIYTGFDRTAYFVNYAKTDFPEYDFRVGEFDTLGTLTFDITYTRHTIQHAAPEVYQDWIRWMLGATKQVAIIVWHPPCSQEHFDWKDGWNNTYDREIVDSIIRGRGFSIEAHPAGDEDEIYLLRRNDP